jgi:hypothetical protein
MLEMQQFIGTKAAFCTGIGLFAAHRVGPFQAEAALYHPLFRKPWMRFPMQFMAFAGASYVSAQFVTRFFPKLSMKYYRHAEGSYGVNQNVYQGNQDLVSKFRLFDGTTASADSKQSIEEYLDEYQSGPISKAELLNRIADGLPVDPNYARKF